MHVLGLGQDGAGSPSINLCSFLLFQAISLSDHRRERLWEKTANENLSERKWILKCGHGCQKNISMKAKQKLSHLMPRSQLSPPKWENPKLHQWRCFGVWRWELMKNEMVLTNSHRKFLNRIIIRYSHSPYLSHPHNSITRTWGPGFSATNMILKFYPTVSGFEVARKKMVALYIAYLKGPHTELDRW